MFLIVWFLNILLLVSRAQLCERLEIIPSTLVVINDITRLSINQTITKLSEDCVYHLKIDSGLIGNCYIVSPYKDIDFSNVNTCELTFACPNDETLFLTEFYFQASPTNSYPIVYKSYLEYNCKDTEHTDPLMWISMFLWPFILFVLLLILFRNRLINKRPV
jgi:hypothetical protein